MGITDEAGADDLSTEVLDDFEPELGLLSAAFVDFVLGIAFDLGETGGFEERRQMVSHSVVPAVGIAPRKKGGIETAELGRRFRVPGIGGMVVVEDDDESTRAGGGFHIGDGIGGIADPLKGARGGDDIEVLMERQLRGSRLRKGEMRMEASGMGEQTGVAVDSDHAAFGPYGFGDVGGDGTGATTDVEDGHAGFEKRGEVAMVRGEGAATENLGVGLMGLSVHSSLYRFMA